MGNRLMYSGSTNMHDSWPERHGFHLGLHHAGAWSRGKQDSTRQGMPFGTGWPRGTIKKLRELVSRLSWGEQRSKSVCHFFTPLACPAERDATVQIVMVLASSRRRRREDDAEEKYRTWLVFGGTGKETGVKGEGSVGKAGMDTPLMDRTKVRREQKKAH
ncbi:hypothetical protein VTI74DRAFT_3332 [Chaetomium olivicolor]